MIVAVDGPAASGKGTLAARLSAHYGWPHLDTGALYRGVARDVLAAGAMLTDAASAEAAARALDTATLGDPALRTAAMGEAASTVAAIPAVRAALLACQRAFGRDPRGAIIEGRDIGTVIAPDAEVKLFVTASLAERARRRHAELARRGETADLETLAAALAARDAKDAANPVAPFRMAPGAHLLETSAMAIEEVFDAAVALIDAAGRPVRVQRG